MTTSFPSGLGASFGIVPESAWGTKATVTRWHRFDKESFQYNKTTVTSVGLHQGLYQEKLRRNLVQKAASGGVTLDLTDANLGSIFKQMLGASTATTNGSAAPSKITTYYPADILGLSCSIEVGRPTSAGTIQSFYYEGAKIADWTIGVQRGQLAKLDLTWDAKQEDVAQTYTSPTFVSPDVFDFSQASLKLGGTPSTTSNRTTISGGAAPTAVVQSVTVKGTNPMKVDRYTLGSQTKSEQLSNNFRAVEIEVQAEFANLTDFYTSLFATDTATPFELKFTGGAIAGGLGDAYYVDIVAPAVFWNEDPVLVAGPDVIVATVKGVALDNGADNVINISTDSTEATPNT